MSGNTLGKLFTVTSAGESHGPALIAIVDGCPPNIPLNSAMIQHELDRRKPGQSRYTTQRRESDQVQILSGVFNELTTGTPIALMIKNEDQRSADYEQIKALFRPSHADYSYQQKYGIRDYRGGGRASARETAMRVAAGAIAKQVLKRINIQVRAYLSQLGPIKLPFVNWQNVNENDFFCADTTSVPQLSEFICHLRRRQDSIGAEVTVIAEAVPPGWGEPVFDRLDADLAKALMSINAVKAVEIGDGFAVINQLGSEHRDEMTAKGFLSNHAGGIIGGISSGQNIIARVAFKPTPSISLPGQTIDHLGQSTEIITKGRHDPCVGIRGTPIVEAMTALVLVDHWLRHRGQNNDVTPTLPALTSKY